MITRVYKYGLLPPTLHAELVAEQISQGHRYYNTLTEIERERRAAVRPLVRSDELENLDAWLSAIRDDLAATRADIKARRQASRSRVPSTAEQKTALAHRLCAWTEVSRLRADVWHAVYHDPAVKAQRAQVEQQSNVRVKAARSSNQAYWGTQLIVERAVDAARKATPFVDDPTFRRWNGAGAVAVQLQRGLATADALSCLDRRFQLDMRLQPCGSGKGKPRPRVRLRVGSAGRDPIWAEWPVVLHRPLPSDAVITWVEVHRQQLAGRDRWSLHVTLNLAQPTAVPARVGGAVAVDLGWRKRDREQLRVAYLVAEHVQPSACAAQPGDLLQPLLTTGRQEVLIGPETTAGLRKCADLQAIRDQHLNTIKPQILTWLQSQPEGQLPEWFREAAQYLPLWRSPRRFAALAVAWRAHSDFAPEMYALLEEWRVRDKHLWTWQENLRDKVLARRLAQYRALAARLALHYDTLVLEDFDLRNTQRRHSVEAAGENENARRQQPVAATSVLRTCLIQAFIGRGRTAVKLPPENTTRDCAQCGSREEWDQAKEVEHRCTQCNALWDQDVNAGDNLLLRWRERPGDAELVGPARAGEPGETAEDSTKSSSKWGRLGRHVKDRSQSRTQTVEPTT